MTLEVLATMTMVTAVLWVVTLGHTVWKIRPGVSSEHASYVISADPVDS